MALPALSAAGAEAGRASAGGSLATVRAPAAPGGPPAADASTGRAWSWPVAAPRRVLRAFIGPPQPWMPGHRGIDVAAVEEGVVLAPADGVVRFAGTVVDRGVLSIDHGGGVLSSYEPVVPLVATGDPVVAGQIVASIAPGHCAPGCLHVGVRHDGAYRNPLLWFGGAEWPVLLPTRPD
ncbi:MAG: M23 family metallopeptidase [Microbacteriaceae bacterium]|nr:M23 family metallopeptidase [Microbacteriaceae bacterium]